MEERHKALNLYGNPLVGDCKEGTYKNIWKNFPLPTNQTRDSPPALLKHVATLHRWLQDPLHLK